MLRHPSRTAAWLAADGNAHPSAMLWVCLLGVLLPFPSLYQVTETSISLDFGKLPKLVLGGVLGGLFCWLLLSWLYRNFCRMLGGQQVLVRDIRIGLGWGLLPAVLLFAAATVCSLFWVHFAYEPAPQGMEPKAAYMALLGPLAAVFFLALLYAYGVLLLALSGVSRLPIIKAFFAFIITLAVSFFPLSILLRIMLAPE